MIKVKRLKKIYPNNIAALNEVSLSIVKNEFVYLVGSSGAGKSTLLRMLYCADSPSSGSIYVDGFLLSSMSPKQIPFLRRNIGVVFQDFKLILRRSLFENIAFALQFYDYSNREIKKKVHRALELVGLMDKLTSYPAELSGGEQQRACIARAIVNKPPILLADEPTGSLDPEMSWEIIQLLGKINKMGTTVIVATHNRGIVDDIRKRVIALDRGKITRDQKLGSYYPS